MKRIPNILGGLVTFGLGVAVTGALFLLRREVDAIEGVPSFIVVAALGVGCVGALLREIGLGLLRGKTFFDAAGIVESRKTSPVVLILAAILFVPFWVGSLILLVTDLASGAPAQRLAALAGLATFLSAVVLGLVREWRRKVSAPAV